MSGPSELDINECRAIIAAMWKGYSAHDAAQLIGLPEAAVQGWLSDGLVGAADGNSLISFRDLAALRSAKALLDAGESVARAGQELARLRTPSRWNLARSGRKGMRHSAQLSLPFSIPAADSAVPADIVELPGAPSVTLSPVPPATADQWLARAQVLEARDAAAAIDAYRRSLRLRPDCSEAWVNLGRLLAESSDPEAARECFRRALDLDPEEPAVYYNLGVLAQDGGQTTEAIELYRKALELDAQLAEAHYNLATLFDSSGDARAAIRHINEYRKLTRAR